VRSVHKRYGLIRAGLWVTDNWTLTAKPEKAWATTSIDEAHEQRFVLLNAFGLSTTIQALP
jgi:hypothetical protein